MKKFLIFLAAVAGFILGSLGVGAVTVIREIVFNVGHLTTWHFWAHAAHHMTDPLALVFGAIFAFIRVDLVITKILVMRPFGYRRTSLPANY